MLFTVLKNLLKQCLQANIVEQYDNLFPQQSIDCSCVVTHLKKSIISILLPVNITYDLFSKRDLFCCLDQSLKYLV